MRRRHPSRGAARHPPFSYLFGLGICPEIYGLAGFHQSNQNPRGHTAPDHVVHDCVRFRSRQQSPHFISLRLAARGHRGNYYLDYTCRPGVGL